MQNKLWSLLNDEQYERLCECRSRKSDIYNIAKCFLINKGKNPQDAVICALEHLECNNQSFYLTDEEYFKMTRRLSALV